MKIDYKALREGNGFTLQQIAAKSGYSVATINGLENYGEGSGRLKSMLKQIYGVDDSEDAAVPTFKPLPPLPPLPPLSRLTRADLDKARREIDAIFAALLKKI